MNFLRNFVFLKYTDHSSRTITLVNHVEIEICSKIGYNNFYQELNNFSLTFPPFVDQSTTKLTKQLVHIYIYLYFFVIWDFITSME